MQGWVKIKKNRKFLDKKIRISRRDSMVLNQMGSPVEPSGSVPMRDWLWLHHCRMEGQQA